MNYQKFLFKKTFKNIPNLVPIFLFLIIVIIFFIFNNRAAHFMGFTSTLSDEIEINKDFLKKYEEEKKEGIDTEELNMTIKELKNNIKLNQEAIRYYEDSKWSQAIQIRLDCITIDIENLGDEHIELKESMIKQKTIYEKLVELNTTEEVEGFENKGITFTYWIMSFLIPILFTLVLCVFLTSIFTEHYYEDIDKEILFPKTGNKIVFQRLLFSFTAVFSFYIVILLISFIIASLFNGTGNIDYPIIQYQLPEHSISTMSVGIVLAKSFVLQILTLLATVTTVNLVSQLVRANLNTLFLSSLILIGQNIASSMVAPLYKVAHLLPGTYFSSVSVITGAFAKKVNNTGVNFQNGIIILSLYVAATILISGILTMYKQNRITLNRVK